MSRKPSEIAQFKLRIRESLRRQLESAATHNKNSINAEIANRLQASFTADNARTLDEIVVDLDRIRRWFAALLGADKLAADPEALGQAIALLEAFRGRAASSSEPKIQRAKVVDILDQLSHSVDEAAAQGSQASAKPSRKKS